MTVSQNAKHETAGPSDGSSKGTMTAAEAQAAKIRKYNGELVRSYIDFFEPLLRMEHEEDKQQVRDRIRDRPTDELVLSGLAVTGVKAFQLDNNAPQSIVVTGAGGSAFFFTVNPGYSILITPDDGTATTANLVDGKSTAEATLSEKQAGAILILDLSRASPSSPSTFPGERAVLPSSKNNLYRLDIGPATLPHERCMKSLTILEKRLSKRSRHFLLSPGFPLFLLICTDLQRSVQAAQKLSSEANWTRTVPAGEGLLPALVSLAKKCAYAHAPKLRPPRHKTSKTHADDARNEQAIEKSARPRARSKGEIELMGKMNDSQRVALRLVVQKDRLMTLVLGPPGTGKSIWAASLICSHLHANKPRPVLCTAQTRLCVDQLADLLSLLGVSVLRVGRPSSPHSLESLIAQHPLTPEIDRITLILSTHLDNADDKSKQAIEVEAEKSDDDEMSADDVDWNLSAEENLARKLAKLERKRQESILANTDVVCATCIGVGGAAEMLRGLKFPLVVIDEASQIVEPAVLIPLLKCTRQVVMIGDPCQLPATVLSEKASRGGLNVSLFERLLSMGMPVIQFQHQYRMHPSLAAFSSWRFYNNSIINAISERDRLLLSNVSAEPMKPQTSTVRFVHVDGNESIIADSYANEAEADCVCQFAGSFLQNGLPAESLGIITFYTAQVGLLTAKLPAQLSLGSADESHLRVSISTVDGFQGREKDVIFLNTVRSNVGGRIGFLRDWRRLNVALTRGKHALIVVGNLRTLSSYALWKEWIGFHSEHDAVFLKWDEGKAALAPITDEDISLVKILANAKKMYQQKLSKRQKEDFRHTSESPVDE